jgi:hypothetical protein
VEYSAKKVAKGTLRQRQLQERPAANQCSEREDRPFPAQAQERQDLERQDELIAARAGEYFIKARLRVPLPSRRKELRRHYKHAAFP